MRSVEVLSEDRVRSGFLSVDRAELRYELPDGTLGPPVFREKVERGDSAAVLIAEPTTGRLLFVNQFRYPALRHGGGYLTEIVAGAIDAAETPEQAARREAKEELGVELGELVHIASVIPSPGTCSEMTHVYFAELAPDSGPPVPQQGGGEDLELVELSDSEAFRHVDAGEFGDAKTVLALLWLRSRA
jgi:ADP-ribose pyrophosphatase